MNNWAIPVQQAMYKGVLFDVISVDDVFDRAIVQHDYPFVNGADLEDMGINAQSVKLQAICFGRNYYADYQKLLAVIQQKGADVLVHPIRGRMPNMLLVSANLRHDAENVNYVTLDLTFSESTPMQPIFVFEHSLLSKLDRFFILLDSFIANMLDWWGQIMDVIAASRHKKSRILAQWGAVFGCFEQLGAIFEFDPQNHYLPLGVTLDDFKSQNLSALNLFKSLIDDYVTKKRFHSVLGIKAEFSEIKRDLQQVLSIPKMLTTGQAQRIKSASQFFAVKERQGSAIATRLSTRDVQSLKCVLHLLACATITKVAVDIIESFSHDLTPNEIEFITQQSRLMIVESLNEIRALENAEQLEALVSAPNNGLYTATYQLGESLRNMAGELMQIAITAINQKPPLIIKEVGFNGTLQQIAHDFYGNHTRYDELLRLNPQIRNSNFIASGTLLNCYSR
ncbi:DNA circularization protein [Actinobacillus pleuropneumoniae]|uniref:DNA circularization protein n=1 Tax=Actinobacillus pleuropneumoniae TaxID=715 RepID=UPI003B018D2F